MNLLCLEQKDSVFNCLSDVDEVQSSIRSHVNSSSTIDVNTDGTLRAKMCPVIFVGQQMTLTLIRILSKEKWPPPILLQLI